MSYEKANSCKAVGLALEIGAAVLFVGVTLYGAYYVSQPENQEEIKESLSDYKNMTEEGMKSAYEMNKKLFNDFCDYAISNGGGSAAVYMADGNSYSVNEMAQAGFPDFDYWDKEIKKQENPPSSGGLGNIWDALSFGLDLLDFIAKYFNDNNDENTNSGVGGIGFPQRYYMGDDGYKDYETGCVDIEMYGLARGALAVDYSPLSNQYFTNSYTRKMY